MTFRKLLIASRSSAQFGVKVTRFCSSATALDVRNDEIERPVAKPSRIVSAICVQRFPTLCREKSEMEIAYEEFAFKKRQERSRLSNYELEWLDYEQRKQERDRKTLEEGLDASREIDESQLSPEELNECRLEERSNFHPADRKAVGDVSNDFRTVLRKLDSMLYLIVKKDRQEHAWQVPQGGVEDNEDLMTAAQRELQEECGSGLIVNFLSKSPSAYLSYSHPPLPFTGYRRTKVFFIKAQYVSGDVRLDPKELVDFAWVTKEEMACYVSKNYYRALSPSLLA